MGGSTKVQAPQPSQQELEIQSQMLSQLKSQDQLTRLIMPYMFSEMGYHYDQNAGTLVKLSPEAKMAAMSEEERKVFKFEQIALDQQIAGMGFNPNTLTRFQTEDEALSFMGPEQQRLYQLNRETQNLELKALRGELPVSPGLERELQTQEGQLRTGLSQRLGPNYELSTPAIQSLGRFEEGAGLLREESRRGMLPALENIRGSLRGDVQSGLNVFSGLSGLRSGLSGQNINYLSGLPGQYQSNIQAGLAGLQPYQFQRGLDFQATAQTAQNRAQRTAGLMQLAGTALGAGGMYFGLKGR